MGRICSALGYNKHGGVKDNTKTNLGKVMCECRQDSRVLDFNKQQDSRGSETGTVVVFVEQGDEHFRFHKRRKSFDYVKSRRFCIGLVTQGVSTSRLESHYFQFNS